MTVKLLTEHHLEFLSLKGGCTGSSESTLVKILHIVGNHSHDAAQACAGAANNDSYFKYAANIIIT